MNVHRNDSVTQSDVDELQTALEVLQRGLLSDKNKIIEQIDQVLAQTNQLKQHAAGGQFEPALNSVHDLLVSLRQGVDARAKLATLQA